MKKTYADSAYTAYFYAFIIPNDPVDEPLETICIFNACCVNVSGVETI